MIQLTDEEIRNAVEFLFILPDDVGSPNLSVLTGEKRDIAIAKAQLKKVVEWLLDNELIPSYDGDFVIPYSEWQALLEEVK